MLSKLWIGSNPIWAWFQYTNRQNNGRTKRISGDGIY